MKWEILLKKCSLVVFDMDGTLVESEDVNYRFYKKVFSDYNIHLNEADWVKFFSGKRPEESIKKFFGDNPDTNQKNFLDNWENIFKDNLNLRLQFLPEIRFNLRVKEIFDAALAKNKKIVIFTSTRKMFADQILKNLGIRDKVTLFAGDHNAYSKLSENGFKHILSEMSTLPENALYLDDNEEPLRIASKVGFNIMKVENEKIIKIPMPVKKK